MFTGIIEEIGTIAKINREKNSAVLTIMCDKILEDTKIGDSIAVNGVCLTVTGIKNGSFTADVMHETLNRSSLSLIEDNSCVNLERAMPPYGRFGGHIVSGHIDGTGTIIDIRKDDNAIWFKVYTGESIMRYIIEKGSIAIDGISLTVAKISKSDFSVSAIPHTILQTTLRFRKKGDIVNLENDLIAKYVERLINPESHTNLGDGITREFLQKYGF